jgi:hypothetical protein
MISNVTSVDVDVGVGVDVDGDVVAAAAAPTNCSRHAALQKKYGSPSTRPGTDRVRTTAIPHTGSTAKRNASG